MNALAWLLKLIAFNTVSKASNLKLISEIEDWFLAHQITTRLTYDQDKQKANLFASLPTKTGEIEGGVLLSGHTDVVPVENQIWETDPFQGVVKADRVYGRGSADMKGFLAVILSLVPVIKTLNLSYPVHFAFSYDEEVGGKGAVHLIKDFLQIPLQPKICIVGEPTLMRPVIAHKGIQLFHCRVKGKAAHSSLTLKGCNAIEYAAKLICFIRSLAENLQKQGPFDTHFDVPFSTLSTNHMQGGTAINIIPSGCEFFFELRHLPQEKANELVEHIEAYVEKELIPDMRRAAPEATIQLEKIAALPSFALEETHSLINVISRLSGEKSYKVAYATEAGLFMQAGIPTIIWGPGSIEQAHAANEYIALTELKKCENLLLAFFKSSL